jgi:hypothetical protein
LIVVGAFGIVNEQVVVSALTEVAAFGQLVNVGAAPSGFD